MVQITRQHMEAAANRIGGDTRRWLSAAELQKRTKATLPYPPEKYEGQGAWLTDEEAFAYSDGHQWLHLVSGEPVRRAPGMNRFAYHDKAKGECERAELPPAAEHDGEIWWVSNELMAVWSYNGKWEYIYANADGETGFAPLRGGEI